jgi:hypothetical protein
MSDVPSSARAPGGVPADPVFVAEPDQTGSTATAKGRHVAQEGGQAATRAASEIKGTAAEQAQRVAGEVGTQARSVVNDVRDRLGEQARGQSDRLAGGVRQIADQLDEMRGDRADSPAATVVSRVAGSGRQLADYLEQNGPEGVLREVQDFARRRPGAFLAAALAAGFVVGRLGKSVAKAEPSDDHDKPGSDAFVSRPGGTGVSDYPSDYAATGTEYAATGTGTPVVVEEVVDYREAPR